MNANTQRAMLLFDQSRHELAEAELRQGLAMDPHDAFAHALLGLCLAKREKFKEASEEAQHAIHLSPDSPFGHYVVASIYQDRHRNAEALAAIQEALRLDPSEPDYFALLASIHGDEKRWSAALEAAEHGLRLDSEHITCTNLRAVALVKLGRKAEAGLTIQSALSKDPENAVTHANQGWTLLEQREPERALEHFRESLRLDPENEWARHGIIEALKARYFIYALMLRYFLWMSRLSSRAQWGIVLGGYFGYRILGTLSRNSPALAPWLLPLKILYVGFALLTWTADPIFNLLLRLNKFGRLSLSREKIMASNFIGSCMLIAIVSLVGYFVTPFHNFFLLLAAISGFLIIPLAGTFNCSAGWPRTMMSIYTAGMAAVGVIALVMLLGSAGTTEAARTTRSGGQGLATLFLIAAIGSPWVANILMSQRPKR